MASKVRCKHSGCKCQTDKPSGYCSDACSKQQAPGGKCGCGHSDCK